MIRPKKCGLCRYGESGCDWCLYDLDGDLNFEPKPDAIDNMVAENERLKAENAALCAQLQQPENKPLTLDELQTMDGEPIWTETIGIEESGRWELCTCETVRVRPLHQVFKCVTADGEATDYEFNTYGKTWLAYDRKPNQGG